MGFFVGKLKMIVVDVFVFLVGSMELCIVILCWFYWDCIVWVEMFCDEVFIVYV